MKRKRYFLNIRHVIRVERAKKRLIQKELAQKIGVSSNFYTLIENRNRYPSEEILEKIAEGLKTTPNKIIG